MYGSSRQRDVKMPLECIVATATGVYFWCSIETNGDYGGGGKCFYDFDLLSMIV